MSHAALSATTAHNSSDALALGVLGVGARSRGVSLQIGRESHAFEGESHVIGETSHVNTPTPPSPAAPMATWLYLADTTNRADERHAPEIEPDATQRLAARLDTSSAEAMVIDLDDDLALGL